MVGSRKRFISSIRVILVVIPRALMIFFKKIPQDIGTARAIVMFLKKVWTFKHKKIFRFTV